MFPRRILTAIVHHRRTIALTAFLGFVIGGVGAWQRPEAFESRFTVRVEAPDALSRLIAEVRHRDVTVETDADLLRVTCLGASAEEAHDRCAAVLADYVRRETRPPADVRDRMQAIRNRLSLTTDSLEGVRRASLAALTEQEELATSRAQNPVPPPDEATSAEREALQGDLDRLTELSLDLARGRTDAGSYRDLYNYPVSLRTAEIARLLIELAQIEDPASDPRALDVEQRLAAILEGYEDSLENQIRALDPSAGSPGYSPEGDIARLDVEIARLRRAGERLEGGVRRLGQELDDLLTPTSETDSASPIGAPGISIVARPSLPSASGRSYKALLVLLGTVLGSALGIGMALYKDRPAPEPPKPIAAPATTRLPVLGAIPPLRYPAPVLSVRPRIVRGLVPRRSLEGREQRALLDALGKLIPGLDRGTIDSETGGVRSIAITSAMRGEGTTFTACNLALVSAASGIRTLLIDCDFEERGVGDFFRFPAWRSGWIDVLTEHTTIEEARIEFLVEEGDTLDVLPAGSAAGLVTGGLPSAALDAALERAEVDYDLVIVDTPPEGSAAGASTVPPAIDTTILVQGSRTAARDRALLDGHATSPGRILGVVHNNLDAAGNRPRPD